MKSFLIFGNSKKRNLPREFQSDDNRNPDKLVRFFLEKFTKRGDLIFDQFAGLGTTLIVGEAMGRIPFGIELDKKRAAYIKSQIKNKTHLILGNSLKISSYKLPKFDFCFTSPPYMAKCDIKNPISGYSKKGSYEEYLNDLSKIFFQLKRLMKRNSYIVIEVSNLKGKEITTLAWDIAKIVSEIFHFEGEIAIGWKGGDAYKFGGSYGYGYDHSYCLVFKNK